MSKYTVVVGNVGNVYSGKSKKEAAGVFEDYKNLSKMKSGRASGEDVSMFEDDELIASHDAVNTKSKPSKTVKEVKKPSLSRNSSSSDKKSAYCMKCKSSVTIKMPKSETLSNGVHAVRGVCPGCGTKVFRLMGK